MGGLPVLRILPPMVTCFFAGAVLFKAAVVTEKCARVPALVNSVLHQEDSEQLDPKRQYVVQFISQSSAGMDVKGVRITAQTVMKSLYLCGALALAVLSQLTDT